MTDYPHEVQPLFAEPYFRANIAGVIGPQEIAFIQSLPMIPHQGHLVSDNLCIFEAPELKRVRDAVQEALERLHLRDAIEHCEKVRDYGSRDLFYKILHNEEEHVDFIEKQQELIEKMGLQNYIQLQTDPANEAHEG